MAGFQRDRDLMREHAARGHTHHGGEIDEAPGHRNIGGVQRPDLGGTGDRQLAQQVRSGLVARRGFARPRLRRVHRPDAFCLTIKNAFSPDFQPSIMPGVSTDRAVQICGATSHAGVCYGLIDI